MSETLSRSLEEDVFGAYPLFIADPTYRGMAPLSSIFDAGVGHQIGGFLNNGDGFELPLTLTGTTIDYYDNTGTQIVAGSWAGGLTAAEVNASATAWAGWPMLDATDGLMYVMAQNTTTNTLYPASINAAGTVVGIGAGVVPTTAFSPDPSILNPTVTGAAALYRTSDGSGNLFLRSSSAEHLQEIEINVGTGAIVTDTAIVANLAEHYKTASGIYVGNFVKTSTVDSTIVYLTDNNFKSILVDPNTGVPFGSSGLFPLQWNGRIVLAGIAADIPKGVTAMTVVDFESAIDRLAEAVGG